MADFLSPRSIYPPDERIAELELEESLAQCLPSDILIEIVMDACEDTLLSDANYVPPMLLTIASVCRCWRDITLGTPTLWSSINFCQWGDPPNGGRLTLLLELYVARSMNLPLRIRGSWNFRSEAKSSSSLDVLIWHSNRWRTVDFSIPLSFLQKLNTVKGQISLLESLTLNTSYPNVYDGFIIDCFESAPALRALKQHYSSYLRDIRFPWIQLVDFTTNYIPLSNSLHNATLCINLTSMTLVNWTRFEAMGSSNITLPFLRNLQLFADRGSIQTSVLDVFSYITVPHLTSLTVHASHPDRGFAWKVPQFLGMMNRSQPFALRSLDLRNIRMVAETLIRCLEALPSLETLIVADFKRGAQKRPRVISMLIRRLTVSTYTGEFPSAVVTQALIPTLTALTLVGWFKDDYLVDMIKSRLRSSTIKMTTEAVKLQYLCLEFGGRSISESVREEIQDLVRTGIGLEVCIREYVSS